MSKAYCKECGGQGGSSYFIEPNDYLDARPSAFSDRGNYQWATCATCNGRGVVDSEDE